MKEQVQKMQTKFESDSSEWDEYFPRDNADNQREDGKPRYRVASLKAPPKVKVELGFGKLDDTAQDKIKHE